MKMMTTEKERKMEKERECEDMEAWSGTLREVEVSSKCLAYTNRVRILH